MNKLPLAQAHQILARLWESSSMRSISRVADVSINTVTKLLEQAGEGSLDIHHETVRDVKARRIQCDDIWSFCHAKQKYVPTAKAAPEGAGNVWTWTAIDSDTKLIVSYLVGGRDADYASEFMDDLHARLANCVKLTTDGQGPYLVAIEEAFRANVDYAVLVKSKAKVPRTGKARSAATVLKSALALASGPSKAVPTPSISARRTLSARTSPCVCRCAASLG